jgi:hypothetical protein
MTYTKKRIAVLEDQNPIAKALMDVIQNQKAADREEGRFLLVEDKPDLVISLAYNPSERIDEMDAMERQLEAYDKSTSHIFLSWWHPLHDVACYQKQFSPEKASSRLMDTNKVLILQLPVNASEILKSIDKLLGNEEGIA